MFEDGTEHPGTSELNNEKEMEVTIVQTVELNYLSLKLNMKAVLVGHLFSVITRCFSNKNRSFARICSYRVSL